MCVSVCVFVCLSVIISLYVWVIFVYVDTVYGFYGYSFLYLIGFFSMITCTPTVLSVLYAYVLSFCICTCTAQLSMFHMERCSRKTLIIIILVLCRPRITGMVAVWLFNAPQYASVSQGQIC